MDDYTFVAMNPKQHWEDIYTTKQPSEVSWTQAAPTLSLQFIAQVAPRRTSRILDVGGGNSPLVDALLTSGYSDVTVNDLSGAAMKKAQMRLGHLAHSVNWVEADITRPNSALPKNVDVWHDRAVFHFLIKMADR
jgi:2-polyprenyl-3-methyl-5-hydroxy-6-metoxy-1,4-benzoquinol methylase